MQRDYILRIIEQLGAALVEIRRRILRQQDAGEIREDLAETATKAGLDLELLRALDASTLVMLVSSGGDVELAKCWLMAELLYLDGLEKELRDADGRDSLYKARMLYDLIRPMGASIVGLPEAAARIAEIDDRLDGSSGTLSGSGSGRPRRLRARGRVALAGLPPRAT